MSMVIPLTRPEPAVEFIWVKPDDISHEWDTVLPGVERVAQYADHWRPEDVYMELRLGNAHLHVCRIDGRYAGFIVAKQSRDYDGPTLHAWVVYAVPGKACLHRHAMGQLKQWAKDMGARRITFTSPRKGWDRLARKLGFEPAMQLFECEV